MGDGHDDSGAVTDPPEFDPHRPLPLDELGARTGLIPLFVERQAGPARAFREEIPAEVMAQPIDPGEAWAIGPDGQRMWGKYGAAGILAVDRQRGVLLQHRAKWNHFGGTWGIPGGALNRGETPLDAALREAEEETGVEPAALDPLCTRVVDLGFWRYTTVIAVVNRYVRARVIDAESAGVAWVQPRELHRLKLHPAFGEAWPTLRHLAEHRPALVVDLANVMGSRGDGWWRDPAAAASRLLADIAALSETGVPAELFGLDAERCWPDILVVLEGRGRDARLPRDHRGLLPRRLACVRASGSGDDEIVEQIQDVAAADPGRPLLVATSDRELRERVAAHGAQAIGSGRLRALLDDATTHIRSTETPA